MPTVIDELIVRLSLDPRLFTAGERQMVESLRRMQAAAQQGAQRTNAAVGQSVVQFFNMIQNPIAGLHRQFQAMATWTAPTQQNLQNLANQGQQTGATITRSMGGATAAVRALGIAGLAAFATYEALNKTFQAMSGVTERIFRLGIGAGAAGMGVQEFGAVAQALRVEGHVPEEQTQAFMSNYAVMQAQAAAGEAGPAVAMSKALARYGINVDPFTDTPEQMMLKIARAFAAMTPTQATAAGGAIGMTPELVYGLRTEGARDFAGDIARERARAPTQDMLEHSQRFLHAMDDVSTAFRHLTEVIMLEGGLADKLIQFANWLSRLMGTDPEQRGGAMASGFDWLMGKLDPNLGEWSERHGLGRALFGGGGAGAPAAGQYADTINAAAASYGVPAQMLYNVIGAESNFDPNAIGPPVASRGGARARGLGQFMPEEGAKYVGGDLSDPTKSIHGAAHYLADLYARTGSWRKALEIYTGGTSGYAHESKYGPEAIIAAGQADLTEGAARGQPGPRVSSIQHSQAMSSATTINHGDNVVNVGDIVVHAPSREGAEITKSVVEQLREQGRLITHANTGLQ